MQIAGVDEAGRGPLAGPVYAAAVILNPKRRILGLQDSKLLTAEKRESLFEQILKNALAWGVGRAEVWEIDKYNILQATFLSMRRAVAQLALTLKPDKVWVDGNQNPKLDYPTEMIISGDKTVPAISAASILAKVLRDREMAELDQAFPGYGFAKHKGYGTKEHLNALQKLGACVLHRTSFAPVRLSLSRQEISSDELTKLEVS